MADANSAPKQGYANSLTTNGRGTNSSTNNTNFGIRNPNKTPSPEPPSSLAHECSNNGLTPVSTTTHCTSSGASSSYNPAAPKPVSVGTSIGEKKTQFMDSYLKFLQGERDDDPPPVVKPSRKLNYPRAPYKRKGKSGSGDDASTSQATTTGTPATDNQIVHNLAGLVGDDGHRIKILSQTQILPKKRPHAQMVAAAAAAAAAAESTSTSVIQHPAADQTTSSFRPYAQQQQQQEASGLGTTQHFVQQHCAQLGGGTGTGAGSGSGSQGMLLDQQHNSNKHSTIATTAAPCNNNYNNNHHHTTAEAPPTATALASASTINTAAVSANPHHFINLLWPWQH